MVTGVGVVRGCSLGRFEGVFAWVFAGLGESKWMRERQTQWLHACSAFGAGGEQGRVVVVELLCCPVCSVITLQCPAVHCRW